MNKPEGQFPLRGTGQGNSACGALLDSLASGTIPPTGPSVDQGIVPNSFHRLFFSTLGVRAAVMLRTEPAAPSLPGPSGAAGFHPDATSYRLQQPFRLRRSVAPFLRSLHPVARKRAVM
ncbi:hypothetical protein [Leclercia adecarboxylata]|uniref:hypothetical protein n=1 Tax=Leclercia adecarboxylata TaxID=83655 RepID=UPI00294978DB|nr:hypothetical protein [Leclercia adecarboxylata]MDV5463969.1 hypothetical protein [Leclercia adecarboxylata]